MEGERGREIERETDRHLPAGREIYMQAGIQMEGVADEGGQR